MVADWFYEYKRCPKQFWWIQYEDVVESNDISKTLVTNSADIQYAKWQHGAGIEKLFTYYNVAMIGGNHLFFFEGIIQGLLKR